MIDKDYVVGADDEKVRLDCFLTEQTGLTRSEVQKYIKAGKALSDSGKVLHANYHVSEGERIYFSWELKKEDSLLPQELSLDILYEDDDMIAVSYTHLTLPTKRIV